MLPSNPDRRGIRILLVDDEYDSGLSIKLILEAVGYNVDIFTNPKEVLLLFAPNYYDLLLLDIRMPGINGFELYQKLIEMDGMCKVCFITAFEAYYESLLEFFPALDVKCFIRKPVSQVDLITHVLRELNLDSLPK